MSPTFRLVPEPGPLMRGEAPEEAEADLTETELEYLAGLGAAEPEYFEPGEDELAEPEFLDSELLSPESLSSELPSSVLLEGETDDDAERVAGALAARRTAQEDEFQTPRRQRWTHCFTADEAAQTVRLYEENVDAAASDPPGQNIDRASCIVMLNVGLGRLLSLRTADHPARGRTSAMPRRPRTVPMGVLTVNSVDGALNQLVRQGRATGPLVIDFNDSRGRRAGSLAPVSLRSSVLAAVVDRAPNSGCWYAFGLSLVDATHSVMLLVDFTGSSRRIYWLDQFTRGLTREVTTTLDAEITTFTQALWQRKLDTKGVRFSTPVRLWRLRKPVTTP
ncbi:hypothetical protein [Actinoplanes sp. GCM10030250]|uniref:hypothetical protein n=1 Tax=Actinoplanes sp. GCM10030250 TaxID=3273376 RepID=UPI0036235B43